MECQQLSVDLKYAQKYIDEALQWLMKEGQVKKKDVAKKSFYIAFTYEIKDADSKRVLRNRIKEIAEIEKADQQIDLEITKLEKKIKDLKLTPTTDQIRAKIASI